MTTTLISTIALVPSLHSDPERLVRLTSAGRWLMLVLATYLALVTILNLWARRSRSSRLRRLVHRITPRFLGLLFAGLVATAAPVTAGAEAGATGTAASDAPVMALVEPGPSTAPPTTTATPTMEVVTAPGGVATWLPWMDRIGSIRPSVSGSTTSVPATPEGATGPTEPKWQPDTTAAAATAPATSEELGGRPTVHVVAAGEHFWPIARATLDTNSGAAPTDGEITRYWAALVEANRDRLVDPDNTDLLFPGQELVLPAPEQLG